MKNLFYYISIALLLIGCKKDNEEIGQYEISKKDLKPTEIIVEQDGNVIKDALKQSKIILKQGENYNIRIVFTEAVELKKGNFLKLKTEDNKLFYADFYGKNLNHIKEKVIFSKNGFNDFSLEIEQEAIIPDRYLTIQNENLDYKENEITSDPDGKTIWVTNSSSPYFQTYTAKMKITFLAPVIFGDDSQEDNRILNIKSLGEGDQYLLEISTGEITSNSEEMIKIPVYTDINGKKGAKISEIIVRGDFSPHIKDHDTYNRYSERLEETIRFYIQENLSYVFIDNINSDLIESYEVDIEEKGDVKFKFKEKINEIKEKIHLLDVYEGELDNDKIIKKSGAKKKEIFIEIYRL